MRVKSTVISVIASTAVVATFMGGATLPARATGTCPNPADSFIVGDGTLDAPFQISTVEELMLLRSRTDILADHFILTANLDMTGCSWTGGIGTVADPFTGTFDGAAHAIENVDIAVAGNYANSDNGAAGLFAKLGSGSVVKNLTVTGRVRADITGADAFSFAGGIAGQADGATIENSTFRGSVTSVAAANHPYAGGILGSGNNTAITGSGAAVDVSATDFGRASAGGIAGFMQGGPTTSKITDSWAVGSIYSHGGDQSSSGGLVGWADGVTITRSFTGAYVEAGSPSSEPAAGGLAGGGHVNITDSFSRSTVKSQRVVGGLVGTLSQSPGWDVLTRSYASGDLRFGGATNGGVGGVVGWAMFQSPPGAIETTSSFWDQTTTGAVDPAGYSESPPTRPVPVTGATGVTSSEMTSLTTFVEAGWEIAEGFDSTTTWNICPAYNDGMPYLPGFFTQTPCDAAPNASLDPSTQSFSGEFGSSVNVSPYSTSGFVSDPVFTILPKLPYGVALDAVTGAIAGEVTTYEDPTSYTVTAFGGPYLQSASATTTMTVASSPEQYQISDYTIYEPNNGIQQATASRPDGAVLTVARGQLDVDGAGVWLLQAILTDSSGSVLKTTRVGGAENDINWGQPALAYNPMSGGFLMCASRTAGTSGSEPICQHLHEDGTPNGDAFAVAPEFADSSNQVAIAYSPVRQQFLVGSTAWNSGAVGRFVAADGSGVVGDPINFVADTTPALTAEGGLDLAYSTESDTFAVVVRAKQSGSHKYAPWVYMREGDGSPLSGAADPVRFDSSTSTEYNNGSVAYSAAANTFMVVAYKCGSTSCGWESAAERPLTARPFNAETGAAGTSVATSIADAYQGFRYRASVAADGNGSGYLVVTALKSATSGILLDMALRLDSTGAAAGELTRLAGSASRQGGYRPRVSYRAAFCDFVASYNTEVPDVGYQLFLQWVPGSNSCGTPPMPTPTVNPNPQPWSPTPSATPTAIPTPRPTVTAVPVPPVPATPTTRPTTSTVPVIFGSIPTTSVTIVPSSYPNLRVQAVSMPRTSTNVSTVEVRVNAPRAFAVKGLPAKKKMDVILKTGGMKKRLGSVVTSSTGQAILPGVKFRTKGTATIEVAARGVKPLVLRVKVK